MKPRLSQNRIVRHRPRRGARTRSCSPLWRQASWFGIVALLTSTSTTQALANPPELLREWNFGTEEDARLVGWPDGWTRRTGLGFPKYNPIRITKKTTNPAELAEIEQVRRTIAQWTIAWQQRRLPWTVTPESAPASVDRFIEKVVLNPYLEFQLDGGAAEAISPFIAIEPGFVYGLSCLVKSEGNGKDYNASASLQLFNDRKELVGNYSTQETLPTKNWQRLSRSDEHSAELDAAFAQIRLSVVPRTQRGAKGKIGFDLVRLTRSPRMILEFDRNLRIYQQGESVTVTSRSSGLGNRDSQLEVKLTDHDQNLIQEWRRSLVSTTSPLQPRLRTAIDSWTFDNLEPGYYEMGVRLTTAEAVGLRTAEPFIVLPASDSSRLNSKIGISLQPEPDAAPEDEKTESLISLLLAMRVGSVKLPIQDDTSTMNSTSLLLERIDQFQGAGIEVVGVLSPSIGSLSPSFVSTAPSPTSIPADGKLVRATGSLELLLQSISTRLRTIQIGWDEETEIANSPGYQNAIEEILRVLRQQKNNLHVRGSTAPSAEPPIQNKLKGWQLYSPTEMTASETKRHLLLARNRFEPRGMEWFSMTPISSERYSLETRIDDLTERMLLLVDPELQGNYLGWVSNPMSDGSDLLDSDGIPQKLFLPFRSLAELLTGASAIGPLDPSQLGKNMLLERDGKAQLLLWGDKSIDATMYLGHEISVRDVWGRSLPVESTQTQHGEEQSFRKERWPVIVDGVDLHAARWRMGMKLAKTPLSIRLGDGEQLTVELSNPFPFSIHGTIQGESNVLVEKSDPISFHIGQDSTGTVQIPVQVDSYADDGPAPVKLMVEIDSPEGKTTFAIEENVTVGNDEVKFELTCEIDKKENLIVHMEAINRSEEIFSFDCYLTAPDRKRKRTQVTNLRDRDQQVFVFPNGQELIGKTLWLQCQQIGESRIINKRIVVERNSFR